MAGTGSFKALGFNSPRSTRLWDRRKVRTVRMVSNTWGPGMIGGGGSQATLQQVSRTTNSSAERMGLDAALGAPNSTTWPLPHARR